MQVSRDHMGNDGRGSNAPQARGPLRCPECGSELRVERLEVEDESGRAVALLFDCPKGDFYVAATAEDLVSAAQKVVTEEVRRELWRGGS